MLSPPLPVPVGSPPCSRKGRKSERGKAGSTAWHSTAWLSNSQWARPGGVPALHSRRGGAGGIKGSPAQRSAARHSMAVYQPVGRRRGVTAPGEQVKSEQKVQLSSTPWWKRVPLHYPAAPQRLNNEQPPTPPDIMKFLILRWKAELFSLE